MPPPPPHPPPPPTRLPLTPLELVLSKINLFPAVKKMISETNISGNWSFLEQYEGDSGNDKQARYGNIHKG